MRKSFIALAFLVFCPLLVAQEALNNDSVIKLVKAGLSDDFIISSISAKPGAYETSTDGINSLKAAGASDKVIAAVLAKASSPRAGGDVNARTENNLKCYTLEFVPSDHKWWHGPGTASDKYDEISESIRNELIVAFDKEGLSLAASPEARCYKSTIELMTVKTLTVKTGGALSRRVLNVEITANFRFVDGSGHLLYEKGYLGRCNDWELPALTLMRDRAILSLVDVIASDEGLLKSLTAGIAH